MLGTTIFILNLYFVRILSAGIKKIIMGERKVSPPTQVISVQTPNVVMPRVRARGPKRYNPIAKTFLLITISSRPTRNLV